MFKSRYIIRFDDVDGAGIVYYPRFLNFCHKTFEDLFNEKGPMSYPKLIKERGVGFPTVHIEADFFKPFFYGDNIVSVFAVSLIKNRSLITDFRLFKESGEDLCFKALITLACIDIPKKTSIPIPNDLRTFFEGFCLVNNEEKEAVR